MEFHDHPLVNIEDVTKTFRPLTGLSRWVCDRMVRCPESFHRPPCRRAVLRLENCARTVAVPRKPVSFAVFNLGDQSRPLVLSSPGVDRRCSTRKKNFFSLPKAWKWTHLSMSCLELQSGQPKTSPVGPRGHAQTATSQSSRLQLAQRVFGQSCISTS